METGHGFKYRQLHIEDYLREIPAEQGRVSGVYAHEWITGDTDTNANFWTDNLLDTILRSDNLNAAYKRVKANNGAGGVEGMQVDELLPWGVSNSYKVYKLNQLIRGWINYYKLGSMKELCKRLDSNIRYRLRMCIWKHWKTPKNKEKNLVKLGVPRWAAHKVANTGNRIAHMCHNGWVQKAINNKRLADFGLISMLDYYTARCVTC